MVETTLPVEMSQPLPVELTVQNRQPLRQQTTAWAKALEKLHTQKERVTARRVAADEAERRAQFDRFWDNLLSVPSPSNSSEGLSYVNPDKPVQTLYNPSTLHDQQHATSHWALEQGLNAGGDGGVDGWADLGAGLIGEKDECSSLVIW